MVEGGQGKGLQKPDSDVLGQRIRNIPMALMEDREAEGTTWSVASWLTEFKATLERWGHRSRSGRSPDTGCSIGVREGAVA